MARVTNNRSRLLLPGTVRVRVRTVLFGETVGSCFSQLTPTIQRITMNVAAGASRQPVIWKKSRRKFMNQLAAGNGRRLWPIAGAGGVLIAAGVAVVCLLTRAPPEVPPSTVPPAPAGDITTQV